MCEKTIVRYSVDRESTMEIIKPFGDENYLSEKEFEDFVSNKLVLAKNKEPVYYACGTEEDICTIGGHADSLLD